MSTALAACRFIFCFSVQSYVMSDDPTRYTGSCQSCQFNINGQRRGAMKRTDRQTYPTKPQVGEQLILLTPLAMALAIGLCGHARASTIAVNSSSAGSVVGSCTLLDAVTSVNTAAAVNGCGAGNGTNDTIDLTGFASPTTITFASSSDSYSALVLTQPVTIQGAVDAYGEPLVTLQRSATSGTPDFRLIATNSALSVYGLALTNGRTTHSGGAIYSAGSSGVSLSHMVIRGSSANYGGAVYAAYSTADTIDHCTMTGNTATMNGGAIEQRGTGGTLTLSNSTISGNASTYSGGGVVALGYLSVIDSTLSGNESVDGDGAAIKSYGPVLVTRSTISGNATVSDGHALFILNSVKLTNSTISGNSGGGIFAFSANLYFCTVYGNSMATSTARSAGVYFAHSGFAYGSIITGNTNYDVGAPYNIPLGGSYDIIASSGVTIPADTRNCPVTLGALANFGGSTRTMPLLAGSCAIGVGPFAPTENTDQRGLPRPAVIGTRSDIGAFEKQSASDPDFIFINGFGLTGSG
jgi:hypothetical protein